VEHRYISSLKIGVGPVGGIIPRRIYLGNLEELQKAYALEDKDIFREGGVDSNNKDTGSNRPKKISNRPTYLTDFVWCIGLVVLLATPLCL